MAQLHEHAARAKIGLLAAWCPREANRAADALSKARTRDEAREVAREWGLELD